MEALKAFEKQLTLSAPQPRHGFEQALAEQLRQEFTQRKHSKQMLRASPPRQFARFSPRTIAIMMVILIISTSAVIALGTVLHQFLSYDAGLKSILEQGRGHEIGISQTIGDFTVTLEWAYADNNRLTLAYMIAGVAGAQYTNLISDFNKLTLRDTGEDIQPMQGMNVLVSVDANGEIVTLPPSEHSPVADRSIMIWTYDLSGLPIQNQPMLDLYLEVDAYGITLQQRTALPIEQFDAMKEGPEEHFTFEFSVPLTDEQRIMNTAHQATDQNITVTLKEVTVSPSQTRVTVCFMPPDPARIWTAIPHLTTNQGEVAGGGGVRLFTDGDETCQDYTYFAGMYDYTGTWQLEIFEFVGFGKGGNDQQRIQGSWFFEFQVPF